MASKRKREEAFTDESDDEVSQTVTKEETSSDMEMEEPSDDDELADDRLADIEKFQIGDSWVDCAGQTCRWVSRKEFSDGVNNFYSGILIDKRLFCVGDTVYAFSPTGSDSFVGKVVCLYQVCITFFNL